MTFRVYIANLGKYNEGELVGDWIDLPCTRQSWERLMCENKLGRMINGNYHHGYQEGLSIYEEYAIHDIECDVQQIQDKIGEYSNIQQLNFLAAALEEAEEPDIIFEYLSLQCVYDDWNKAINAVLQEDEIPYFSYDFPGISNCRYMSAEEKYGYTIAYINGTSKYLEERSLDSYFDFEDYGRDLSICDNITLLDDGYLIDDEGPDLDWFSSEEIKEEFEEYAI